MSYLFTGIIKRHTGRIVGGILCAALLLMLLAPPSGTMAQTQPNLEGLSNNTVFNYEDTQIYLYGTHFEDPPVVTVGGETLTEVTWVSAERVDILIPQGFAAGVYTVTLTNPGGLSDSLIDALTVLNPGPQPTLTDVTPASVVNDVENTLTLTGTEFNQWTTVRVGNDQPGNITINSATEIAATLPVNFAAGVYDVTVSNPGGYDATLPSALIVQNPTPVITQVSPATALNDANTRLTITGSGFITDSVVYLNGIALNDITYTSPTEITALLPWGWDPGVYDLQVINPGPGAPSVTLADAVTVTSAFGVWTTDGPYGGIARLITVHPDDENLVFASMHGVGLFRSEDGGASWNKVYQKDPFAVAVAPSDHTVIYAAWAILNKSTDAGQTWNVIYNAADPFLFGEFSLLLVHPQNANRLYAGKYDPTNHIDGGFFLSTDGGFTWVRKETGLTHKSIRGAVFHPDDPNHIIAVTSDGYVYETTDSAEHWIERGRPYESFTALSIDPFGNHDVWAGFCPNPADYAKPKGIAHASLSDLSTWTDISPMVTSGDCYAGQITFDPVSSGIIYVAAHTAGYKSTDGGETWQTNLTDGFQVGLFALSAANHNVIYATHWGKGIQKSVDGGQTWEPVIDGLAGLVPTALAAAHDNIDEVYFGSNPYGIFWSESGGHSWIERAEYVGSSSLQTDPFTPGRVYSTDFMGLRISSDHGQTWQVSSVNATVPAWCTTCIIEYGGLNSQVFGIGADPNTPGKIIVSLAYSFNPPDSTGWPGGIAISYDYGATFTQVEAEVPRGAMEEFVFIDGDPNLLYASGWNGILRSTDGGLHWEDISPFANQRFTALAVNPNDPQMLFTAFYAVDTGGVYRSTNGGEDWQKVAPYMGWKLVYAPTNPAVLYLGSDDGLLASYDNGETWTRAAGALGYARITRLVWAQDAERYVLYVGTAGGVEPPALTTLTAEDTSANAGLYRKTQWVPDHWIYLPLIFRK